MYLMAFDTSTENLSVGIYVTDTKKKGSVRCRVRHSAYSGPPGPKRVLETVAETATASFLRHSEILMPTIEKMLRRARITPDSLEMIAVGLGPGSFTGLRIGLAVAKTMAWTLKIALVGVDSMEAVARAARYCDGRVAVLADAKRSNCYAALYEMKNGSCRSLLAPSLLSLGEFLEKIDQPTVFLGSGSAYYADRILESKIGCMAALIEGKPSLPRARWIAEAALERAVRGKVGTRGQWEPLYLYRRDCNVTPAK